MAKGPRVTITDVARKVGVHPSTVSRVLNPQTRSMINESTVKAVAEAAEALGYQRHLFATALRTGKSNTIGIIVPDITNPVFPPIIRGIEAELEAAGYTAIIANTDNTQQKERLAVSTMMSRHVDGIISATAQRDDPTLDKYAVNGLPVVLVNRHTEDGSISSVTPDDHGAITELLNHVHKLGHRKVAHLAGPAKLSTGFTRSAAFKAGIAQLGLERNAKLIVQTSAFTEEEGFRATCRLLDSGQEFTAVIAGNDLLALGCYRALGERSLKCPQDVSVTGFNDMPFVDKVSPPLTTVRIPHFEMGQCAARMLLDQIGNPGIVTQAIVLKCDLIVRGSTGPVRKLAKAR